MLFYVCFSLVGFIDLGALDRAQRTYLIDRDAPSRSRVNADKSIPFMCVYLDLRSNSY